LQIQPEESVETVELRPLSLGELLDRTFSLYRKHFWLFVGIMAIPAAFVIPERVLLLNFQGTFFTMAPGRPPVMPSPGFIGGVIAGYLAFMVVFMVVYSVGMGAAASAVADAYLGRTSTVRGSYAKIRAKFWKLLGVVVNIWLRLLGIVIPVILAGAGLTVGITVATGNQNNPIMIAVMMLLFVLIYVAAFALAVWFALRYAVSIPVLMIEDLGVLDTIRRSVFLTRGRRGHIFLGLLVGTIIAYVGLIVFEIPFTIATMIAAMRGHWPLWLEFTSAGASAIGLALAGPISMIVIVLLYYDTRIRKEAFDLQFMMSSLERPAPAAGTVSPA
jgi:hypothetical protein